MPRMRPVGTIYSSEPCVRRVSRERCVGRCVARLECRDRCYEVRRFPQGVCASVPPPYSCSASCDAIQWRCRVAGGFAVGRWIEPLLCGVVNMGVLI